MRLPRDVSGAELVRALFKLGYVPTRQVGSHVRPARATPVSHHLTVPLNDSLRVGNLSAIIAAVSEALQIERDELLRQLFG